MSTDAERPEDRARQDVDPAEFLRALLKVSPEDPETVRERTPGTRPEKQQQEGPSAEYGEDR